MPIADMNWNILWSSTGGGTLEMNIGAQKAVGQASLGQADGEGLCNSGIRGFRTRPNPAGPENVTDFGDNFYNWPNTVFDQSLTSVTFALALGSHQEGTVVCNILRWS
ncbi:MULTISPECIES: hypothetical protein [Streptomyces]|uniref:Uncharacterized protein n=1 Tax=Streptomyces asoensis TaxID=249586 RepID=A0ABQ3SCL0_9ACTN|nr:MULTISPECIES: hypothetical protein [Streptomyces]MBK3628885.1 hypothetical protein [Streptomyces sp. MBT49]MBK3634114.1 hypothetical protein [Streptomyces sp. MBT97]GGQ90881.1 hypothetical protein GCM10010496_64340 [Streptomyces asoensis]GHI65861.1 hypothetical protein Saso_75110 [Streptomyces asoensis]